MLGDTYVNESENLASRNIASLKFLDMSFHNNLFPSCTSQSMLSSCPLTPLQLAPPDACFYLPGQPSNDSALSDSRTCTQIHSHTHFLPLYPSGGLTVSVPMVFSFFSSSDFRFVDQQIWCFLYLDWAPNRDDWIYHSVQCRIPSNSGPLTSTTVLCFRVMIFLDSEWKETTEQKKKNRPTSKFKSWKWKNIPAQ